MMRSQFWPASSSIVRTVLGVTLHSRAVERTEWNGRSGTDGVAFHKAIQDHEEGLLWKPYIGPKRLLLRLNEPFAALLAFVALDLVTAPTGLYRFDPARMAGHCEVSS
jgi:hypothetical protein